MIYFTQSDLDRIEELKERLTESNILYPISETLLDDYATPEYIHEICEEIQSVSLNEDDIYTYDSDSEGHGFIGTALGLSKRKAKKMVKDPKTASICLRALRDKYEEIRFKESRAAAENRGFFATVLYTIKKAIYWILKKFGDLKDDFMDLVKGRPENSSRAKKDYVWLRNREDEWFAKTAPWYTDSEH